MTNSSDKLPAPGQPEPSILVEPQDSPVPFADLVSTPPEEMADAPQAAPSVPPVPGAADIPERVYRNHFSSAKPKPVEDPDEIVPAAERKGKQGLVFTPTEIRLALNLREQGHTLKSIATKLDRSIDGVRQVLHEWEPTQELARAKLKSGALKLAERVIDSADVPASLEVLDRLDVLPKRDKGTDNRVQVILGFNVDGMQPPNVTVTEEPT